MASGAAADAVTSVAADTSYGFVPESIYHARSMSYKAARNRALEAGDFARARQLVDRLELRRASEPEPAAGTQL